MMPPTGALAIGILNMGALDFLSDIGTALTKDIGGGALPTAAPKVEAPKPTGLGDFVSIPGPKGSKMMLDSTSSEAVLKQMQDFLDKRNDPMTQFNNRLANAQAYTIGDPAQAAAAIKGRQELNMQQAKDVQEMQLQLAQFKAAQQQQKIFNQRQAAELGGAGMPGTAGAGAGASSLPPEIRRALSLARNQEEYTAIYNKYAEAVAQAEAAAGAKAKYDIVDVYDADGNKVQMTAANASKFINQNPGAQAVPVAAPAPAAPQAAPAPAAPQAAPVSGFNANVAKVLGREGGYKENDSNGFPVNFGINKKAHPDVDVKNLTQQQAVDIYKREYWDEIGGDNLPPATAAVAFDAAVNHGQSYAKQLIEKTGGDPQKMLAQRMQDYTDLAKRDPSQAKNLNGWLNRLKDVRASLEPGQVATQARPTQTQTQNAPIIQAPVVGGTGKGAGEVKQALSQKAGEANIEVQKTAEAKEQEEIRGAAGKREASLKTVAEPRAINDLRNSADNIIETAKKKPHIFGLGAKGDVYSTIISASPTIPFLKGDTEETIANLTLSPKDMEDRRRVRTDASKLQADWAKEAFAGSRMEQAFLKLAETAKGVSLSEPANVNIYNAYVIRNMADYLDQKRDAWEQYKRTTDNPKFEDFEESSTMKQIDKNTEGKLRQQFPQVFKQNATSLKDKFPKKQGPN
jgi:hypothetical protein